MSDPENEYNVHDPDSIIQLRQGQGSMLDDQRSSERKLEQRVYPESFAGYPESLSETRATTGAEWTVRDALISALRDYDSGVIPENSSSQCLIVFTGSSDDPDSNVHFFQKTPSRGALHALLEKVRLRLFQIAVGCD